MAIALVTGPTSGIGKAFAEALAGRGFDLVLVARNAERLAEQAADVERRYAVGCELIAADLAVRGELARVERRLADANRPVDLLVNNAGFALGKSLLASDTDDEEYLLDVLCKAVLRLSKAALPVMLARRSGVIVNVSSMAGFIANGTYGAAKAWVTSFTEGLAVDLLGTGVRAYVSCPGYVRTEFQERAGIDPDSLPEVAWIEADAVVEETLRQVDRGARRAVSPVVIPTARYRVAAVGARHAPRGLLARIARQVRLHR